MAAKEQSFEDLLKDAPSAPDGSTVSIVGSLAKSDDPKKFVLFLSDGSSLTLDTAAVKKHTVLGQSVGQTIVQVDVDRDAATAAGIADDPAKRGVGNYGVGEGSTNYAADNPPKLPVTDLHATLPVVDFHLTVLSYDQTTIAYLDQHTGTIPVVDQHITIPAIDQVATIFGADQAGTLQENISDPGNIVDPAAAVSATSIFPFSMQTAHQIAGRQLESLNALAFGGQRTYLTAYNWTSDHHTVLKAFF